MRTYQVAQSQLGRFVDEVARIGATFEMLSSHTRRECVADGLLCDTGNGERGHMPQDRLIVTHKIAVSSPVHGEGWSFLAKVEHLATGNVVSYAPLTDEALVAQGAWANVAPTCDHCHTNRDRKVTYIVANVDGHRAQVGSTCIDAFLGLPAGTCASTALRGLGGDEDEYSGRGHRDNTLAAIDLLTATCAAVRVIGWKSKGMVQQQGGTPTAEVALSLLNDPKQAKLYAEKYGLVVTPADAAQASAVIDYVQNMMERNGSDYVNNLVTILSGERIEYQHIGLACSAISPYLRHLEQQARDEARKASKPSEFVGKVGDKLTINVTVDACRTFDGAYGPRTMVKLFDAEGNVLVWWATGSVTFPLGGTFSMKATVKDQKDDAKYGKQTIVTRAKLAPTTVSASAPATNYAAFKASLVS